MPINIKITSTFDSGDGPDTIVESMDVDDWYQMIAYLIERHAEGPVRPDKVEIEYT